MRPYPGRSLPGNYKIHNSESSLRVIFIECYIFVSEDKAIFNYIASVVVHLTIAPPEDREEEEKEETIDDDDTALDASSNPGWDRVDAALVSLKGLSVSNTQAKQIHESLYHKLLYYDKRPLTFRPRLQNTPHGRFGRRKQNWSGWPPQHGCYEAVSKSVNMLNIHVHVVHVVQYRPLKS